MTNRARFVDAVTKTVEANLRFHREMGRLTLRFLEDAAGVGIDTVRGIADAVRGRPEQTLRRRSQGWEHAREEHRDRPASALVLEGELGEIAYGVFMVENTLRQTISTGFSARFVGPDRGIGETLIFEPSTVHLRPGEQMLVKVGARITPDMVPGLSHKGEIAVTELPGTTVPIIVRRRIDEARTITTEEGEHAVPSEEPAQGTPPADDGGES